MNRVAGYLALVFLTATPNFALHEAFREFTAVPLQNRARPQPQPENKEMRRFKDFERARKLLFAKKVPFDPNVLLTPCWRKTLKPIFDQMPEFQTIKRGGDRLKGVEMAHTLYLPEQVKLEGDTVIIVRNLIYDGRDAVIRGPFNIYVFPIDQVGLLGTTFEEARRQNQGLFVQARYNAILRHPLPLIRDGRITINTSGIGRPNIEKAEQRKNIGDIQFVKASFLQQSQNSDGIPGTDGTNGANGNQGISGGTGATGANGTCGSASSVNGSAGGVGSAGGTGQNGNAAGNGSWSAPNSQWFPKHTNTPAGESRSRLDRQRFRH